jgi:hypothetical protein
MQKGSSTTYIKDYGRKTAVYRETEMKFLGMAKKDKTLEITTPDWIFTIDLMERKGSKQVNPDKYFIEEFNKLSKKDKKKLIKNSEELGVSLLGSFNGKIEKRAAKILGYTCDKVSMSGMVVYTISNTPLVLKSEGNLMGIKFKETAIRIEKGSVPSSKFKIPEGIDIYYDEQADQIAREQAKATIQSLLEGEMPRPQVQSEVPQQNQQKEEMTPEQQDAVKKFMQLFGGGQN